MSTEARVAADKLYRALEGLVFITLNGLSTRREANRVEFIDAVEALSKLDGKDSE